MPRKMKMKSIKVLKMRLILTRKIRVPRSSGGSSNVVSSLGNMFGISRMVRFVALSVKLPISVMMLLNIFSGYVSVRSGCGRLLINDRGQQRYLYFHNPSERVLTQLALVSIVGILLCKMSTSSL